MEFDAEKHIKECAQNALQMRGWKNQARYLVESESSAFLGDCFDERLDRLREIGFPLKDAVMIAECLDNTSRWRVLRAYK